MPPKKTGLDAIRRKLAAAKKLALKKSTAKPTAKKFIPTQGQILRKEAGENKVRQFFTEFSNSEDFSKKLRSFGDDPKAEYGRSTTIETLLYKIPEQFLQEFSEDYLAQTDLNIASFLDVWISNGRRAKEIIMKEYRIPFENYEQVLDEFSSVENPVEFGVFAEKWSREHPIEDEEIVNISKKIIEEPKREVLKTIDLSKKPAEPVQKVHSPEMPVSGLVIGEVEEVKAEHIPAEKPAKPLKIASGKGSCESAFAKYPWIMHHPSAKIKVYIQPVDSSVEDIKKYIHESDTVIEPGIGKLYLVNGRFFNLQCYSKSKQSGDVLSNIGKDGSVLRSKVLIVIDDERIIQNEDIFELQKKWFKNRYQSLEQKIHGILTHIVDDESRGSARKALSTALFKASDEKAIDYVSETSEYIVQLETILYSGSKNLREYYEKIGSIIIFLGPWVDQFGTSLFKARVRKVYYIPEVLTSLTDIEKLPRVFDDDNVENDQKEIVEAFIHKKLAKFIRDSAVSKIHRNDPTARRRIYGDLDPPLPWNLKDVRSDCVNGVDQNILDAEDSDLISYTEDGDRYCFVISELVERFNSKNFKNPVTGKKLSSKFVDEFETLHCESVDFPSQVPTEVPSSASPVPRPAPSPVSITLAVGFLQKLTDDIVKLEQEYAQEQEDEEDAEEDEEDAEEDEGGGSPICNFCSSVIDTSKPFFKSIAYNDKDRPETVHFCNTKCFDAQTDWKIPEEPQSPVVGLEIGNLQEFQIEDGQPSLGDYKNTNDFLKAVEIWKDQQILQEASRKKPAKKPVNPLDEIVPKEEIEDVGGRWVQKPKTSYGGGKRIKTWIKVLIPVDETLPTGWKEL